MMSYTPRVRDPSAADPFGRTGDSRSGDHRPRAGALRSVNRRVRGAIIGFGEVARNGHWPAYVQSTRGEDRRRGRSHGGAPPGCAGMSAGRRRLFHDRGTWPPARRSISSISAPRRRSMASQCSTRWRGDGMSFAKNRSLLDPVELEKVRALALENGRAVVPVHNWKYAPIIRRATRAIALGRDWLAATGSRSKLCESRIARRPTRIIRIGGSIPAMAGGGVLMDHGWHAVYLARHWFGEDPIEVEASLHASDPGRRRK